ncbi:hypothetical protein RhiirA4_429845 [Rhizophagus irregularis]|uniref:Uncharacterized protein n=1 Tax=Rhizophagus irregularis TaxID=588596 RepID=A0A2I1HIB9_9GLOM|nr:hypothetical protein RhiirA4_429845 [Rhizophagus irregularis]
MSFVYSKSDDQFWMSKETKRENINDNLERQIPSLVNERAASVEPEKLIPGTAHEYYPDYIIIYKIQKLPKHRNQTIILEPLKIKPNQHFLYHGVCTPNIIPAFILDARPHSGTINNEFSFDIIVHQILTLLLNIPEGMVPFLYMVGDSITIKTLSGREWADTVKGHICIEDNTKSGPPLHAEDIIQGPITSNNSSVYHCCNPIQSEKLQVVARTFNGMDALASCLYAIIYLC